MLRRILWLVIAVVAAFWLFGAVVGVLGGLIHLALVAAAVLVVYNVFFAPHTPRALGDGRRNISRY